MGTPHAVRTSKSSRKINRDPGFQGFRAYLKDAAPVSSVATQVPCSTGLVVLAQGWLALRTHQFGMCSPPSSQSFTSERSELTPPGVPERFALE